MRQQINTVRRMIERARRVVCTVLHLERPGARSWAGVLSRMTPRLLADTVSFIVWAFLPIPQN